MGRLLSSFKAYDTKDATAVAADITVGKTAYIKNGKVIGQGSAPAAPTNSLRSRKRVFITDDATATEADILTGKTAYINGGLVTGTKITAAVISVELVDVSWTTNTTQTINLTKGQDYTKCVPLLGQKSTIQTNKTTLYPIGVEAEIIDNAGTAALKLTRLNHDNWNLNLKCYVVEFHPDVSVQQVPWSMLSSEATDNVSITAVDLSKAFIMENKYQQSNTQFRQHYVRARFTSTTQVTFTRNTTGGPISSGRAYVVEDKSAGNDFFSVQSFSSTGTAVGNYDSSISAVTPANASVFMSHETAGISTTDWSQPSAYGFLLNGTTVRVTTVEGSYSKTWDGFVVEWKDGSTVQRGQYNASSPGSDSEQTNPQAITTVDVTKSVAYGTHRGWPRHPTTTTSNSYWVTEGMIAPSIQAGGANLLLNQRSTVFALNNIYSWEVIEFAA